MSLIFYNNIFYIAFLCCLVCFPKASLDIHLKGKNILDIQFPPLILLNSRLLMSTVNLFQLSVEDGTAVSFPLLINSMQHNNNNQHQHLNLVFHLGSRQQPGPTDAASWSSRILSNVNNDAPYMALTL